MLLTAIVAMAQNRVIGKNNQLPWHLPDDLKHFKQFTLGKPVLMGRKTFESIGRALPGRTNVILSRALTTPPTGCLLVHSIEEALTATASADELVVIGGATLYEQCLPYLQRIYLTEVEANVAGDAFFPVLDRQQWRETENVWHPADDRHALGFRFITLERVP